jgi:hypothetical protein
MTTAQCTRYRRWSCLKCVRDGERTKDHENSARQASYAGSDGTCLLNRCAAHDDKKARNATNNQETQSYKTKFNGSPLLQTTTSNSKQQHKITSENNHGIKHSVPSNKPQPTIPKSTKQQKSKEKNNRGTKQLAPPNKLTAEIQFFQMRKMD